MCWIGGDATAGIHNLSVKRGHITMSICRFLLLLALMSTTLAAQETRSPLQQGIELFLQDSLSESLPHLRAAIIEQPGNPDAFAWLADALRRSGSFDESVAMARHALTLAPCHAQAHTTLGDLYNPQFGSLEQADADSTWKHLTKAVECDPAEGIAWFGLWIEGMRTRNLEVERKSLQSLASTGFITPGALAYARWMLASLPKDAILLTNGDMDTYPLVVLQQSSGFRRDVAVVNASLMNLQWYSALMTERHRITGGYSGDRIAKLEETEGEGGSMNTISRQVIASWLDARRKGKLKRPIAIAIGVDWRELVPSIDPFTLAGTHWLYNTTKKPKRVDVATLWKSVEALDPGDFKGPMVSDRDRSPIRRTYAPPTAGAAVSTYIWYAADAMQNMDTEEARLEAQKLFGWIEKFYAATGGTLVEQ